MSWTDDRVERLSALWLEGRSASQIAAELGGGVSRNAVIGKVHRLGLSGRAVAPASAEAAPPRLRDAPSDEAAFAERAFAEEAPASPGARSADLDPAPQGERAGEGAARDAQPFQAPAPAEPPAAAAHTVDDVASIMEAFEPITVDLPALRAAKGARDGRDIRETALPVSDRVTILELSGSMCRWPIGDPTSAEFRFCGCRAVGALPYCQDHARVAFQPVADRRRAERLIRIA